MFIETAKNLNIDRKFSRLYSVVWLTGFLCLVREFAIRSPANSDWFRPLNVQFATARAKISAHG